MVDWTFSLANGIIAASFLCCSYELGHDFGVYGEGWHPGCDMSPKEYAAWRISCDECGSSEDYYMVQDRVWVGEAKLPKDTMMCLSCLEDRIGRNLTPIDFPTVPINVAQGLCDDTSAEPDW